MWATDASVLQRSRARRADDRVEPASRPAASAVPRAPLDPADPAQPHHRPAVHLAVAGRVPGLLRLPGPRLALLQLHRPADPLGAGVDRARQLPAHARRPALLESPLEHHLAGARDGPDL